MADRSFDDSELETFRLLLSTFRDGSGQVILKATGESMPGFRDFERVTADVCGGWNPENKGVFDVLVSTAGSLPYGISCKMAAMQSTARASAFMEMSNSAKKFADEFERLEVDWRTQPTAAGIATVRLVQSWHHRLAAEVDLVRSKYLVLAHDSSWARFNVLCYPLDLTIVDPARDLSWEVEGRAAPTSIAGYLDVNGRQHRLWQLFPNSGGQLKYYPLLSWAEWTTGPFVLERPPTRSLRDRAREYFDLSWPSD